MYVNKIKNSRDNIYFNAVINADPTSPSSVLAKYTGNLTQSIIEKSSDYYCSVIRFILPIDAIPTLIFPLDINQSDYLQSYLQIGINLGGEYPPARSAYSSGSIPIGGTNYARNVMYLPSSNFPHPQPAATYTTTQANDIYYWVYSIDQMITMFNKTINSAMYDPVLPSAGLPFQYLLVLPAPSNATAGVRYNDSTGKQYVVATTIVGGLLLTLTDVDGNGPPIPPTNGVMTNTFGGPGDATIAYTSYTTSGVPRPYFTWDPTTNLISITVTNEFLATGAKIFVNRYMINYLASFNWYYDNTTTNADQYFYLNLSNISPSLTSPYVIKQDYSTISLWFDLRRILIFSNTLPITPEALPGSNANPNGTGNQGSNENVINFFPIITDFAVALENAGQLQEVLVYNPSAEYRLVDLTSDAPLSKIDLQFFWEDRFNNIFPVPISAYQQASVKLGFFKKSLYNTNPASW